MLAAGFEDTVEADLGLPAPLGRRLRRRAKRAPALSTPHNPLGRTVARLSVRPPLHAAFPSACDIFLGVATRVERHPTAVAPAPLALFIVRPRRPVVRRGV